MCIDFEVQRFELVELTVGQFEQFLTRLRELNFFFRSLTRIHARSISRNIYKIINGCSRNIRSVSLEISQQLLTETLVTGFLKLNLATVGSVFLILRLFCHLKHLLIDPKNFISVLHIYMVWSIHSVDCLALILECCKIGVLSTNVLCNYSILAIRLINLPL